MAASQAADISDSIPEKERGRRGKEEVPTQYTTYEGRASLITSSQLYSSYFRNVSALGQFCTSNQHCICSVESTTISGGIAPPSQELQLNTTLAMMKAYE